MNAFTVSGVRVVCACVAVSSISVASQHSAQEPPPREARTPQVWNTGLVQHFGIQPLVKGQRVVPVVAEVADGHDRNGDGDLEDQVMMVLSPSTRTIVNTGVAFQSALVLDSGLVLVVKESAQGNTDLNGDGDTLDSVLHFHDFAQGTTRNLGLATSRLVARGDVVAFLVLESAQGGTDLNGDGDASDRVLHVFDASTGVVVNWGLASSEFSIDVEQGYVIANVLESDQGGRSLNGDRDTSDAVIHVIDLLRGEARNLRLDGRFGLPRLLGKKLVFVVLELYQGVDLNGNGVPFDNVLFEYDPVHGISENRRLIVDAVQFFDTSSWAEIHVREAGWLDLNHDGDASDRILYVRDPRTGSLVEFGQDRLYGIVGDTAVGGFESGGRDLVHVLELGSVHGTTLDHPLFTLQEGEGGPRMGRKVLTYPTSEHLAGIDFNADGDDDDLVVCVYEFATQEFVALRAPLGQFCGSFFCEYEYFTYSANDRVLAFAYSEASEGQRDLNGDGDANDWVVQAFGYGRGLRQGILSEPLATVPPGYAPFVAGDYAVWAGYESGAAGGSDQEAYAYHAPSGTLFDLQLEARVRLAADGIVCLDALESSGDLNGDGDTLDRVLHVVSLP